MYTSLRDGAQETTITKFVNTVEEYYWNLCVKVELIAVRGTGENPDETITLLSRESEHVLKILHSDQAPFPETTLGEPLFVDITWLIGRLHAETREVRFKIHRNDASTKTPRRNAFVEDAILQFTAIEQWVDGFQWLFQELSSVHTEDMPAQCEDLKNITQCAKAIFIPVLPLLQEHGAMEVESSVNESAVRVPRLSTPRTRSRGSSRSLTM